MNRSKLRWIAVLLLLPLFLSGCSGGTYERRGDSSSTLYIGEVGSSFPTAYMPWLSREGVAPTISSLLFSTLFSYDENTGEYLPQLADSWYYTDPDGNPIVTEDGSVDYDRLEEVYGGEDSDCFPVRFELNRNAVWSDGVPVTAEDVYFTFDLAANQKLSNHAGALAWVNDLLHKYDNTTGKLRRQGIFTYDHGAAEAGYPIAEEDRDTVFYMELDKILGAITPIVSTVMILPKHIYEGIISYENPINNSDPDEALTFAYQNPVGCGPYMLDRERTNTQEIVLTRREDYHHLDEDGGPLYKVETLKFILYQDVNVAIYALKKGHLDVLDTSISPNYSTLFEKEKNIQLLRSPGSFVQTLVLNVNAPADHMTPMRQVLTDRRVRQAIALAIDQEELIQNVLNGTGTPAPAGLILSSMADLYNPEADILSGSQEEKLDEANALLDGIYPDRDENGYRLADGKRLSFEILGFPGEQEVIGYLQVLLQQIGIEVKFAAKGSTPENTYLYGGNFDMTIQSVVFSLSNVDIMLKSHFSDLNRSSNYGRLTSDVINESITAMRETINMNKKYDRIREIQLLIAEEYYKVPLYCSDVLSVARTDRFEGWVNSEGQTAFNLYSLQNLRLIGT